MPCFKFPGLFRGSFTEVPTQVQVMMLAARAAAAAPGPGASGRCHQPDWAPAECGSRRAAPGQRRARPGHLSTSGTCRGRGGPTRGGGSLAAGLSRGRCPQPATSDSHRESREPPRPGAPAGHLRLARPAVPAPESIA